MSEVAFDSKKLPRGHIGVLCLAIAMPEVRPLPLAQAFHSLNSRLPLLTCRDEVRPFVTDNDMSVNDMSLSVICFQEAALAVRGIRAETGKADRGKGGVAFCGQAWQLAKRGGKQAKGVVPAVPRPSLGISGRDRASSEAVEQGAE